MSLPLERCAQIRAEMDAGRQRDEVLARAGVSGDEWTVTQREWLDKMGAELKIGRFELTNRYTSAFLERQRELETPAAAALPAAVVSSLPTHPDPPAPVALPPRALPPPVPPPAPATTAPGAPSPW